MEADKPLRRSKRKRNAPTSSGNGRVDTSKRSKREQEEMPLQESSPDLRESKEELHRDQGDSSVALEFMDKRDNKRGLQQMGHDGEDVTSDSDAKMKDVQDRVSRFPDLIKEKIFGCLDNRDKIEAAQVCSTWCHAVSKPSLWKHQKVSVDLDRVTEEELLSLREKEINQIEIKGKNRSRMNLLLKTFPSLVLLHLNSKVHTDLFLKKLSKCEFSSLKDLTVRIEEYSHHVPSCLLQSLPRLSGLREIIIVGRLSRGLVQAVGRECHGLEELTLAMTRGNEANDDINVKELNSLRCLQSLSLESIAMLDFPDFCQENTGLKRLSLHCCGLSSAAWPAALARVTSLETLRILQCFPKTESLDPLQHLVNLKMLHLSSVTERELLSVAKISSLEDIRMVLTVSVTDEMLHAFCSKVTHLKALMIRGRFALSTEVLVDFARPPSLERLHIEDYPTENFLETLIAGPCYLKSLVLRYVKLPSPLKLKHLAQIRSLRELVMHSTDLNCSGLSSLQQETFQLETLELIYCGVSVESIMPLLQTQTSLRKLVLKGEKVREEDFPSPYAVLPNLEVCVLKTYG